VDLVLDESERFCRNAKEACVDVAGEIGRAIRSARRAHGLTQEQLAELAHTTERTVRDIEKGTGASSLDTVVAVAAAVGVTIGVVR
jgi:DNA-binding XRE family transcriptional regulator